MSHEYPDRLRELIQKEIDNTDPDIFSHILLGYGLCGNAILGLARKNSGSYTRAAIAVQIFLGFKTVIQKTFRPQAKHRMDLRGGYMQDGDYYLRKK